ncbi:hypothetical protein GIS00_01210 [Nakamurella sp. YIM 132087]|uniref:YCII-related domain-containing protein n=1 Tax=Nakamurella alba TaxID=2665158 RepID=A0A7K1FH02_9ACTN|nr:YciI family protein [Nakamurella alba]MTD12563.1 hypothetical protein [Nakamurella alba]
MPYFAVLYDYAPGSDPLREHHRAAHRAYLNETDHGTVAVVATGPWSDGEPGALLVVSAPGPGELHAMLDRDPFRLHGAVAQRRIRSWTPVTGPWA